MSFDMKPFEELGKRVAEALGSGPSEDEVMVQRRDFLAELSVKRRSLRIQWVAGLAAAAAVFAAVLGILFKMNTESPIPFWIGQSKTPGAEGQWVRAESVDRLDIRFEGGSEVSLSSSAAARIISSTTEEVRIDLASGKIGLSINGNHHTQWQVDAGPYTVHVTGTVFTTEWDPSQSKLNVTVSRGSVLVTGANLSAHGVQLKKGDHLRVEGEKALIELNPVDDTPAMTETAPLSEPVVSVEDAVESAPETSRVVLSRASEPRTIKSAAKKSEPLLSAEENLDKLLAEGDVETLWQAAMQARYARNGGTAKTVLLTIRDRFKDSKRAETAVFVLGRVYQELLGSPSAAAGWFKRYLDETPSGPLAEEALGRLFDAYEKAGNNQSARRAASQYLTLYPDGLFSDSARRVLSN